MKKAALIKLAKNEIYFSLVLIKIFLWQKALKSKVQIVLKDTI